MGAEILRCARCTKKLGESIVRDIGEEPAYNFLITKFSMNDLGDSIASCNICENCMVEFDNFMKIKKNTLIKLKSSNPIQN